MAAVTAVTQLFAEVSALAHQLRRTDFHAQQGDGLLMAARNVVQLLVEEGPHTVPWIAARQNSSRQNIQIIANRLASEGLAEFRENPAHKKSDLLKITDKGLQHLQASKTRQREILEAVASRLNPLDIAAAVELLRRFREHLMNKADGDSQLAIESDGRANDSNRNTARPEDSRAIKGELNDEGGLPVSLL